MDVGMNKNKLYIDIYYPVDIINTPRLGHSTRTRQPLPMAATLLVVLPAAFLQPLARSLPAARPQLAIRLSAASLLGELAVPPPPEEVVAAVEAVYSKRPSTGGGAYLLTASDLAAAGGIELQAASAGLTQLASALAGADGVSVAASDRGELLYSFPKDVRSALSERSSSAAAREAWNTAKPTLQAAGRVAFGLTLLVSIAVVFAAIVVLQSEASGGRDERRRDDDRLGGGWGGGWGGGGGFYYGWSPLDLLWPRPYYYGYGWLEPPPRMSFPAAIFSFVFGDGDPNEGLR